MLTNGNRFTRDAHFEQLKPVYAVTAKEIEAYIKTCLKQQSLQKRAHERDIDFTIHPEQGFGSKGYPASVTKMCWGYTLMKETEGNTNNTRTMQYFTTQCTGFKFFPLYLQADWGNPYP